MKCPNCGYEIDKPNKKSCPLCGHRITREELLATPSVESIPDPIDERADCDIEQPSVSQSVEASPVMTRCPRCSELIPEENNFCPYCGCNMRQSIVPELSEAVDVPQMVEDSPMVSTPNEESDDVASAYYDDAVEPEASDDNIREENWDEYIDNGSYIPYEGEEEDIEEESPKETGPASWLIIGIAAIAGVLLGALLYYLCT